MREIPSAPIDFEAFDAMERGQAVANVFLIPVAVMQGDTIVAVVAPKVTPPQRPYHDDAQTGGN